MSDAGVAHVQILPSMRGFGAAVQKELDGQLPGPMGKSGQKAGQGFADGVASTLQSGGQKISNAGTKLTVGLTLPLIGLGAASFAASRDFNAGMANIATLIPGNTERVGELKTGIMDLGEEVGKSSTELSDGMYNVISAFGDSSESMSLLEINAKAAAGGMAETTDAINLTSAVTKGYGDTSQEAVQKASDLALLTVRLGQTTFPELASSVGAVIPIAQNLGVTQEELFASMAAFTGVTGSASEVATQMRSAMEGLMAPTASASEALEDAGFASGAAAIEELGLAGAIGVLTDAADASGEPLKGYISSIEGQTFAMGLAGAQADDYESKLAEMANAAGTTDEAYDEVTEGANKAGHEWEVAKVKAGNMAIELGDGLAPALVAVLEAAEPVIAKVSDLAAQFAEADPHTKKMILGAVGIVAALGPVMSVVGRVTSAVGGMVKGAAAFGRGAASTAKGVAKIAQFAGRGAMALGRLGLAATKAAAKVVAAGARMAASAARAAARVVAQIAVQIAKWVLLGVQALLHAAKVALAWLISLGPLGLLIAAVIAAVALVIANWDKISAFISQWAPWLWEKVTGVFTAVKDFVLARITDIVGFFASVPGWITAYITWVLDKYVAVFTAVKDFVLARLDDIVGFFSGLPDRIVAFVTWFYDKYVAVFTAVKDFVLDRIDDVVGFFKDLPGRVTSAFSTLASAIKSPFTTAFDAIKSLWNSTAGGFGFTIPDWVPGVGGKGFTIPEMHSGGIVPGSGDVPILARGGEGVFTEGQMAAIGAGLSAASAPAPQVVVRFADPDLKRWLRNKVRVEAGGDIDRWIRAR